MLDPGKALTFPLPALRMAEKRQAEAARIKEKYPDRIPVRCASGRRSTGDGRHASGATDSVCALPCRCR